jgi:chromosome segregation ATPase
VYIHTNHSNRRKPERAILMSTKLETLNQKADQILQDKQTQLEKLNSQLEEEKAAVKDLEEEMDTATAAGDLAGYQKAKTAKRNKSDAIEMHTKRYKQLTEAPLISTVEYNRTMADIMGELTSQNNKAKEELAALADQMKEISDRMSETIEYGNKLLHKWQHDIYKDDASIVNAAGKKIYMDNLEKQFKDFSAVRFGMDVVGNYNYKTFRGI